MAWRFKGNPMGPRWHRLYKGTPAEQSLEDAVAALGVPYRSQFPGFLYGFRYFPDFLLPTLKLVIEVDDKSHNKAAKALKDADRTEFFEQRHGWQVVRCTNEQAVNHPYEAVTTMLKSVGLWPIPEEYRKLRLADCMPQPKATPRKETREQKSERRQRRRGLV